MSSTIGQAPTPQAEVTDLAMTQLRARDDWSNEQRNGAALAAAALIDDLPADTYCVAGLAGAPGTGKSALARLVSEVLERLGRRAVVLSLDDYYLSRKERQDLARQHPLYAQRGVPGTHQWATLVSDLDSIRYGQIDKLRLPRFDKSRDDRCSKAGFSRLPARPDVVILEGWLIGAVPQSQPGLSHPVNDMEAERDADGRWRRLVNQALAKYHEDLAPRLDRRWYLSVPDWQSVVNWRWQQEQELAVADRHLGSREAVEGFLDQFQRIAMYMRATCSDWADVVIRVDHDHVMHVD